MVTLAEAVGSADAARAEQRLSAAKADLAKLRIIFHEWRKRDDELELDVMALAGVASALHPDSRMHLAVMVAAAVAELERRPTE